MVRIPPIEKPGSLMMKIAYGIFRKQFGKVIMPAKVIYARYPKIMLLVKKIYAIQDNLHEVDKGMKLLIQHYVAQLNGCSFCMDMSLRKAVQQQMPLQKFYELQQYAASAHFTEKEKAILNYVEDMTLHITTTDTTFERLKKFVTDKGIIEITYLAASENYLNRLTRPLGIQSDELCAIR